MAGSSGIVGPSEKHQTDSEEKFQTPGFDIET